MKKLSYMLLVSLTIIALANIVADAQELKPKNTWLGRMRTEEPMKLAPENLCITDSEQWKKIWQAWKADDKPPVVDFEKNFVIVGTAHGPNRVMPSLKYDDQRKDLEIVFMSTRMGGPGFGFVFVEMKREGIETVNGKPIEGANDTEFIEVKIRGKLTHGVMAIGGETTGTTITANDITWELDLSADRKLQESAETMNEKIVTVTGKMTVKQGVERGTRYIVKVNSLK